MTRKKNILAIVGSASQNSTNQKLVEKIEELTPHLFEFTIYTALKDLPHFDPELSANHPPQAITALREAIAHADGIMICTPEYIFSIPGGLKNMLEWCVSTVVFSEKPTALITASAQGEKGHQELQLIMSTLMAKFNDQTTLLIQGIKSKINEKGEITDHKTVNDLRNFITAFHQLTGL